MTSPPPKNEYAELGRLIRAAGLLERQPRYYAVKITTTVLLLLVSLLALASVKSIPLQICNAVFLSFAFTQIGFIGHDAGHQQIFRSPKMNRRLGLLLGNLILGLSYSWWVDNHNRHHRNPNHPELDPDVDVPVLAFFHAQAADEKRLLHPLFRYQAYFFFPVLAAEALALRVGGIRFLFDRRPRLFLIEVSLLAGHLVWYTSALVLFLGLPGAVIFAAVHQACFGIYMGSVFAPNHKGMLVAADDVKLDMLRRQVLTARNVRSGLVVDFLYGGLNYQIEHHLSPRIPRNKLKEAQKLVRPFCQRRSIPYHETTWFDSYREILQHLHRVGAADRALPHA